MLFAETPVAVQVVVAVGAVVTPLFTAYLAFLVLKLNKKTDAVAAQVEVVHHATNSLTDRLVQTTGDKAFAEGVKSETDKALPIPLTRA